MEARLDHLDWSLIQSFLAVADEGSLSAAARRLGASQPTLGRHVRALELALGAELFLRRPRGLELSEAGQALITAARAMGDAAAQFERSADGRQGALKGTVRITASEAVSCWHLPAIIADIRKAEPEIEIELVPTDESRNLLYREADIAVRMFRPTQLDVVTKRLGQIEIGLFATHDYLAGRAPIRSPEDLAELEWVGYDASPAIIEGMIRAGLQVDRHFFATRCDHNIAYWALVQAGLGVGFGQVCIAAQDPRMVRIDLPIDVPTLPVWLTAPEAIRHTPRIERVWDMLTEGLAPLMA
jgi:DNA-binding transcriptional LysR family regulator